MKTFLELYKYDFKKEIKLKPTFYKDRDGKPQQTSKDKWLNYVEWATVLVALYDIGEANSVAYISELHPTKPNTLICTVDIDGCSFVIHYPIIDGNTIIVQPNQMQIHKAELRGFVKCVAIHTGLGLRLWQKEESILNLVPIKEEAPAQPVDIEKVMIWEAKLKNVKNTSELGDLYTANKAEIEGDKYVKAEFIKAKTRLGNSLL